MPLNTVNSSGLFAPSISTVVSASTVSSPVLYVSMNATSASVNGTNRAFLRSGHLSQRITTLSSQYVMD